MEGRGGGEAQGVADPQKSFISSPRSWACIKLTLWCSSWKSSPRLPAEQLRQELGRPVLGQPRAGRLGLGQQRVERQVGQGPERLLEAAPLEQAEQRRPGWLAGRRSCKRRWRTPGCQTHPIRDSAAGHMRAIRYFSIVFGLSEQN
jgi:hypothetical protein